MLKTRKPYPASVKITVWNFSCSPCDNASKSLSFLNSNMLDGAKHKIIIILGPLILGVECLSNVNHNHLTLLDRASVAILQLADSISHNIASVLVCLFASDCPWWDVFPFCLLHYCSVLLHVYTYFVHSIVNHVFCCLHWGVGWYSLSIHSPVYLKNHERFIMAFKELLGVISGRNKTSTGSLLLTVLMAW